jgi:hypothetical protein
VYLAIPLFHLELLLLCEISGPAANEGNLQELFVDATQFPDVAEGKKVYI